MAKQLKFQPGDRVKLIKDIDSGSSPWVKGSLGTINAFEHGLQWYEVELDAEAGFPGYAYAHEMEKA
jgi:hypothetical protein